MSFPVISVIIPAYNAEKTLAECLESVLNQSYTYLDIIVVDDGSIDNTAKICNIYAAMDKRIRVIHQENKGISCARNAGLQLVKGDYISFIDADDTIFVDMYENFMRYCLAYKDSILICGYQNTKNDRLIMKYIDEFRILNKQDALVELVADATFRNYLWNKLYPRSLFSNLQFPEGRVYEDIDIQYKLFLRAEQCVICPFIGYNYIKHPCSISNRKILTSEYDNIYAHIQRYANLCHLDMKIKRILLNGIFFSYCNFIFFAYRYGYVFDKEFKKCKQSILSEIKYLDINSKNIKYYKLCIANLFFYSPLFVDIPILFYCFIHKVIYKFRAMLNLFWNLIYPSKYKII